MSPLFPHSVSGTFSNFRLKFFLIKFLFHFSEVRPWFWKPKLLLKLINLVYYGIMCKFCLMISICRQAMALFKFTFRLVCKFYLFLSISFFDPVSSNPGGNIQILHNSSLFSNHIGAFAQSSQLLSGAICPPADPTRGRFRGPPPSKSKNVVARPQDEHLTWRSQVNQSRISSCKSTPRIWRYAPHEVVEHRPSHPTPHTT